MSENIIEKKKTNLSSNSLGICELCYHNRPLIDFK